MKTLQELFELLQREDELTVLELLDLSSEDIVEHFRGKIKQRRGYLEKYFDDPTESEELFGQGVIDYATDSWDWYED